MARQTIKTICNLCGLCGCGMQVTVEAGTAVTVKGDPSHPENLGGLCVKGLASLDILYSPERLRYPMKRAGARGAGQWTRISWDVALSTIAHRLQQAKRQYGAEAVWFHKGSGHDTAGGDVRPYLHRLANLFGSPNLSCPFYICYGPRVVNLFFMTGSIPAPEIENANGILLWGLNPTVSALPRHKKIQSALKRGARLIVVDPRTTHFAHKADVHLKPRPGADCALALGMLRVVVDEGLYDQEFVGKYTVGFDDLRDLLADYPLERVERLTWVPKNEITKAARLYATTRSSCTFFGQALDQHVAGSNAIRAIMSLIAITGNLDVPGGNVMYSPGRLAKTPMELHDHLPIDQSAKLLGEEFLLSRFEFTRFAHPPTVYKAILEEQPYPVKAALIMAANPALTDADSRTVTTALSQLDFLVVADLFMTKTAELADIVLPASTSLEQTYYATYEAGAYLKPTHPGLMMLRPQVVQPLQESWPDWRIIFELGRRLGYGEFFPWRDIEEAIDIELQPLGITVADLRAHPEGIPIKGPSFLYQRFGKKGPFGRLMISLLNATAFRKYPRMYHKYRRMGFNTPSKKLELRSDRYEQMGLDALPVHHEPVASPFGAVELVKEYPLVLTTGAKLAQYVHSQMRQIPQLRDKAPHNCAEMHPATASASDIHNGYTISVATPYGAVSCKAAVHDKIRRDVVQLFHGYDDSNANVLTDGEHYDPVTGATPSRSLLCRVSRELSRPQHTSRAELECQQER